jgi:programmed cell death 6-interacting protein
MFADDLMIIDRLRSEAVNVQEPHISGISRLVAYAAQLKWLGGKFPIDVRNSSGVSDDLIWDLCD